MTSGVNKLEDCVIMAPDHCKEMLTVFSHINNGQNCLERNNGHYEELSGKNNTSFECKI